MKTEVDEHDAAVARNDHYCDWLCPFYKGAWDDETEDRIADALAVARRGRCRTHLQIADHHPWEAPDFRPSRSTWNLPSWDQVERSVLVVATALLLASLLGGALDSTGWTRLGYVAAGLGVAAAAFATDRRLDRP